MRPTSREIARMRVADVLIDEAMRPNKDVEPKKRAKDSDLFRTLVSITLGQADPTRTIDALIDKGAFKRKTPHIPLAGDF